MSGVAPEGASRTSESFARDTSARNGPASSRNPSSPEMHGQSHSADVTGLRTACDVRYRKHRRFPASFCPEPRRTVCPRNSTTKATALNETELDAVHAGSSRPSHQHRLQRCLRPRPRGELCRVPRGQRQGGTSSWPTSTTSRTTEHRHAKRPSAATIDTDHPGNGTPKGNRTPVSAVRGRRPDR